MQNTRYLADGQMGGQPVRANALGIALRNERRGHTLTQEQLARMAGLRRSHYAGLERGKHVPSLTTLMKILRALKVDAQDFIRKIASLQVPNDTEIPRAVRLSVLKIRDGALCPQILGRVVRFERCLRGYSQEELADRAGVSCKFLSGIETGGRDPSFTSIVKISLGLNVATAVLFKHFPSGATEQCSIPAP